MASIDFDVTLCQPNLCLQMSTFCVQLPISEYETLAIGVLNECFGEDENRTADILIRELPNWGRVTSLSLAVAAENKNFIAHSGVQNLLSQIWLGKLSVENNSIMVSLRFHIKFMLTLCRTKQKHKNTVFANIKHLY